MLPSNTKRIAKNTLYLYTRSLVVLLISLYTSRLLLNSLGISDYGIHSVIAGLVTLFAAFSGSLSAAITRFITFELGKKENRHLSNVVLTSVLLQLAMAILAIVVLEVVSQWFLATQMRIPEGRLTAANVVLQCTIFIFAIGLLALPFRASVIAYEKMNVFALISVIEAVIRLFIIVLISTSDNDRLVLYSYALLAISIANLLAYFLYCFRSFKECFFKPQFSLPLLKDIGQFIGWNTIGNLSAAFNNHGVNILFNVFFGVTLNAARGIANQVEGGIMQFVSSLTASIDPQITKSYAANDRHYMLNLVYGGAKYAYFLLLFFALPVILETPYILKIWLIKVPEFSTDFVRLSLLGMLVQILSTPLITASLATGKIRNYQLVVGGIVLTIFPITWLAFYLGCKPQIAYAIAIALYAVALLARLYMLRTMIGLSARKFIAMLALRILPASALAFVFPATLIYFCEPSLSRLIATVVVSLLSTVCSVYFVGLTKPEKDFVKTKSILYFKRYVLKA